MKPTKPDPTRLHQGDRARAFEQFQYLMAHRVHQLESQDITSLHVEYEYHSRLLNRTMDTIGPLETREPAALV